MSTVTITVDRESVTVKGADRGNGTYGLDGGAWTAGLTDDTGTVRVLAIARHDTEPTVRCSTDNGQSEFPEAWTFTDETLDSLVITTVDEARVIESSTDRRASAT